MSVKPHPRIRKTIKWGGAAVTVLLLYRWPLHGAFNFGGVRLAPHHADLLLMALLAPLAVATVGAWILDEIIVPAGTPVDQAKLQARFRRAARVMVPLPLVMVAAFTTRHAYLAWNEANTFTGAFRAFWMAQMYWSCGIAAALWPTAAAFVYIFRPRHCVPGLCPKCRYDRAGLAPGAVCPECGAAPLATQAKP